MNTKRKEHAAHEKQKTDRDKAHRHNERRPQYATWERNAMRNVGLRTASDEQKETRNHERICQESQLVHDRNRVLSRNAFSEQPLRNYVTMR